MRQNKYIKRNSQKKCDPMGNKCWECHYGLGCTLTDCCVNCLLSAQLVNCWTRQTRKLHKYMGRPPTWPPWVGCDVIPIEKVLITQVTLSCAKIVCDRLREGQTISKHPIKDKCSCLMSDEHLSWCWVDCIHFSPHQVKGRTLQSRHHELKLYRRKKLKPAFVEISIQYAKNIAHLRDQYLHKTK